MKLKFTKKLPNKPGFYWYTNFGEHTPVVLEVSRDYGTQKLFASNEEFSFEIRKQKSRKLDEGEEYVEGKFKHGDELWCYIPNPCLPNGKQVEPDYY